MRHHPDKDELNGDASHFNCPIGPKWDVAKEDLLEHMEKATTQLGEIVTAIKESNTNLLGAATGRRQIPLEVVFILLVFWGALSIFNSAKDSTKNIKLNWSDGLQITDSKEGK